MGREIRRVPPNWEHPKDAGENYKPMRDKDAEQTFRDWLAAWAKWQAGKFAEVLRENPNLKYNAAEPYRAWCDWDGKPPDPDEYRPVWPEGTATWYQIYETVSEGTPVSPPFATKQELVDYLVEHGDFWDQKRGQGGWDRKIAEQFVEREHAFSMSVETTSQGMVVKTPRDGCL